MSVVDRPQRSIAENRVMPGYFEPVGILSGHRYCFSFVGGWIPIGIVDVSSGKASGTIQAQI